MSYNKIPYDIRSGGTGLASYTCGDILTYVSGNALTRVQAGLAQSMLVVGATNNPCYTKNFAFYCNNCSPLSLTDLSDAYDGQLICGCTSNGGTWCASPWNEVSLICSTCTGNNAVLSVCCSTTDLVCCVDFANCNYGTNSGYICDLSSNYASGALHCGSVTGFCG